MKKALIAFVIAGLLVPSFSYAQTSDVSTYTPEVQEQITLLQQIISILLEIQQLQGQLSDQQQVTAENVQTIKTQTAPIATGGNVDNTATVFNIFELAYEPKDEDGEFGDVYVSASGEITSLTVDGSSTNKTSSKSFGGDNCWMGEHCTAFVYRFDVGELQHGQHEIGITENDNLVTKTLSI